jgi:hypothetical protein
MAKRIEKRFCGACKNLPEGEVIAGHDHRPPSKIVRGYFANQEIPAAGQYLRSFPDHHGDVVHYFLFSDE